jgi:hypothetical protein
MANEAISDSPVPLDDFAKDLEGFFDRVVHCHEEVLIENDRGEVAILKPAPSKRWPKRRRVISDADHQAFLSSLGGWKDLVDIDKLIENIYESRSISTRPPVDL